MKIAIVKLSALGDIIHAMVVLQFIKKYQPQIEIDWVIEERYIALLEFHPEINNIHVVNIKKAKNKKSFSLLIKELIRVKRFGEYDLIIDMQGIIKSALISRIIPSVQKIGFDKMSIREGVATNFYSRKYKIDYATNIVERNINIVNYALSIEISHADILGKEPFLYSSKDYEFNKISRVRKNILLIPGASFESKRYPVKNFSQLTKYIDANFLVIWGNEDEKVMADKIKFFSPEINVLDKLSLKALISLVSKVDLVIGPDTGPTHLAWALNKPSITLFGPTPGYRNTFSTQINKIVESESYVNPYKINKKDFSIKNIKVTDIVKIADSLLKL
jgi:heptosyltransferase I